MRVVPANHRARKLAIHIGNDAGRKVDSMLARQNLTQLTAAQRDIGCGAVGLLGGASLPGTGNACFFTGTPINGPDATDITDADAAARLLPGFDGAFAGVFWDAERATLVVATDCLGLQPLYMRHVGGELTLVSETKALRGEPDLAAWGAFISIGHPIGDRSLLDGLQRVPPASILIYDSRTRQLDVHCYWHWPEASDAWRDYDFLAALEQDILGCAAFGSPGTLLLSGGFDSRLLLFLLQRAQVPADALVVAHDDEHGNTDGRLATAIAKLSGMPFREVHPPRDFFSSPAYLDYLRASDVGYPSLDLFIAKVASRIESAAVWDGLAPGFVFMPLHQPEGGFDAYLDQEIRGPDSAIWHAAKLLFRPDVIDAMADGFSQDLRAELSRLPLDAHGLAQFVIRNRSRNRAAMNPLKVYANHADAFVPGVSRDFMTYAGMIPFPEKQGGRFYRRLFAQLDTRALQMPFLSGGELLPGAHAGAAYWRERLHIAVQRARTDHPSLFPRTRQLRPARSSFLGGQLFEEGDRWLNPALRGQLKAITPDNYLAWKLLFHWKAWQWLHNGDLVNTLESMIRP